MPDLREVAALVALDEAVAAARVARDERLERLNRRNALREAQEAGAREPQEAADEDERLARQELERARQDYRRSPLLAETRSAASVAAARERMYNLQAQAQARERQQSARLREYAEQDASLRRQQGPPGFSSRDLRALRRAGDIEVPATIQASQRRALSQYARPEPSVPPAPPPQPGMFAAAMDWMRRRTQSAGEEDVVDDRDDDSQTCTSCAVNKRAVICLPCGHCTQCNACFRRWAATPQGATCTVCRRMVVRTQQITQRQRDDWIDSAIPNPHHAGSWVPRLPAGPIYMNAALAVPGLP